MRSPARLQRRREPDVEISMNINGKPISRDMEARTLLVHYIREDGDLRREQGAVDGEGGECRAAQAGALKGDNSIGKVAA